MTAHTMQKKLKMTNASGDKKPAKRESTPVTAPPMSPGTNLPG
jgi:hypothetical protein